MQANLPPFDKKSFLKKLITSKQEAILMQELTIFSCDEALKNLPETPSKEKDTTRIEALRSRAIDEKDGELIDIANIQSFFELLENHTTTSLPKNEHE